MDQQTKAIFTGIALFFFTSCAGCALEPGRFTITNGTDQPIALLVVEVHDERFEFRDIPPGGSVRGRFRVGHEATLMVSGHFANGTEFGEHCGYVVWEDPAPHVVVVVTKDGPQSLR